MMLSAAPRLRTNQRAMSGVIGVNIAPALENDASVA